MSAMFDGFLFFSRASGMLDVVALAMVAIVPLLACSIYLVRVKKSYDVHRKLQITLGVVLLVAVTLFEVDMRLYGWRQYAEASPYYESLVHPALYVHLVFAISTACLWIYVIYGALKHFPKPTRPSDYSPRHKKLAWIAAIDLLLTAITGWVFYFLAFVA